LDCNAPSSGKYIVLKSADTKFSACVDTKISFCFGQLKKLIMGTCDQLFSFVEVGNDDTAVTELKIKVEECAEPKLLPPTTTTVMKKKGSRVKHPTKMQAFHDLVKNVRALYRHNVQSIGDY
jgi:hypothetical protein